MSDLADLIARTPFPGRVRQFSAPDPGHALALAVGCAWCESGRGGHAIAVVPDGRRTEPLVRAGLDLARRLGLGNLSVIPAADPGLAVEPLSARERQPVRLASLGRSLLPPWPPGDALGWLAGREPRLLLPARDPRWGADAATLLALAWIAGDGRRVVWELAGCGTTQPAGGEGGATPPGQRAFFDFPRENSDRRSPLGEAKAAGCAWPAELALIGQLQLPLKIICPGKNLPWPPDEHGLARWWIAASGGAEAAAVLAWALAGEESCLLAVDGPPVPDWPAAAAWTPGAARRLAEGGPATLVCHAGDALAALAAAEACGYAVLQLTGISPLPLPALRRAVAEGPLLVMGEDLARHLAPLAAIDPALRFRLVPTDAASIIASRTPRHSDPTT